MPVRHLLPKELEAKRLVSQFILLDPKSPGFLSADDFLRALAKLWDVTSEPVQELGMVVIVDGHRVSVVTRVRVEEKEDE
jgi:hypothetical protein